MSEAMRNPKAAAAPLRPVRLGPSDVELDRRPDGTLYLRSPHPLERYPAKLTERLEHWTAVAPDRVFLAQRARDGSWRKVTYRDAWLQVRCIAQALIERKLSVERPVAILSGNDIEHALLGLAAMRADLDRVSLFDAENADEAIAILDAHKEIRVVLTDVQMPGSMDGVKLAHYVRERFPPTVLFVVSGNAPIPEHELPARATFLPKPFDPRELLLRVGNILRRGAPPSTPRSSQPPSPCSSTSW